MIYLPLHRRLKIEEPKILLKTGGKPMCFGRVCSSCSTCGIRSVTPVTNPLISHERGKDRFITATNGTYMWSFVTHMFHNG